MRLGRAFVRLAVGGGLLVGPAGNARADGGTVRASAAVGGWRVTVFTAPTPPRAGPVDVSVLVQDAATGRPDPAVRVWVRATPRDRPGPAVERAAAEDAATNKLLVAAVIHLPDPGWCVVRVRVEGDGGRSAEVVFDLEVGDPPPRWAALAGWVGWPALAVALFAAHRLLVRRKDSRGRAGPG